MKRRYTSSGNFVMNADGESFAIASDALDAGKFVARLNELERRLKAADDLVVAINDWVHEMNFIMGDDADQAKNSYLEARNSHLALLQQDKANDAE